MDIERSESSHEPIGDAQKAAILEQLDRLLLDPAFHRSRRYPSLLRFLVSRALAGETDSLKERILGIEVFERRPDYDTNLDPIVRVTVAEVRKRMQRYYQDDKHQDELRITLPAGSYVPVFSAPADVAAAGDEVRLESAGPAATLHVPDKLPITTPAAAGDSLREKSGKLSVFARHKIVVVITAIVLATVVSLSFWLTHRQNAFDAFWSPTLSSGNPILLCIADESRRDPHPMDAYHPEQQTTAEDQSSIVNAANISSVVEVTNMVTAHRHPYKVQIQGQTNFTDLSSGPSILMGAFNNIWTLRLTKSLRFHFGNNPAMTQVWIEDSQAPSRRDWERPMVQPTEAFKDYALIARFTDPDTRQPTTVIAGLGHDITVAAVQFALSSQSLGELDHSRSPGWRGKNVEIVLEAMVVNGHVGSPSVATVHTW